MDRELINQEISHISAKVADVVALLKADHPTVPLLIEISLALEELHWAVSDIE